jgi:hypothetical protein
MADDNTATENAKRQLEKDREASERSRAEFAERTKGKPTPTQEENDLAVLGAPVFEKEDDGSGPDPNMNPGKHQEGRPGGQYQTRHNTAQSQHRTSPVATPPRRSE